MQGARKTRTLHCVFDVVLYVMHAGAMQPPGHGAGTCATAQSLHCGGDAVPSSLPRARGTWPSAGVVEHGAVLPAVLLADTQSPAPPVARNIPQSSKYDYSTQSPAPPVARNIPQSSEYDYGTESPAPPVTRNIPQSSEYDYGTYTQNTGAASCSDCCA